MLQDTKLKQEGFRVELVKRSSLLERRPYLAAMVGTALEYYDNSLYWLMAPLMATMFNPFENEVDGLIFVFTIHAMGILTRVAGGYVIGKLGDRIGRKRALRISLVGTAMTTGLMGLLPTYAQVGVLAPILLTVLRLSQKFFVAGEYNGGAIFTLEHAKKRKGLYSGLYCSSTVVGVLSAAAMTTMVAHLPEGYWRVAYLLGFLTAAVGIYIRKKAPESPEFAKAQEENIEIPTFRQQLRLYKKSMFACAGAAAFFGTVYTIPSSFLVGFLPLISDFQKPDLLIIHTCTLSLFMLALPLSGLLGDKITFKTSMLFAAATTTVLAYPLFSLINLNTFTGIICLKFGFMMLTAWFVGPFHAWTQEQYDVKSRYLLISFSYSIGSGIGAAMPALCMWLWKTTQMNMVPALVLIVLAVIGTLSISVSEKLKTDSC